MRDFTWVGTGNSGLDTAINHLRSGRQYSMANRQYQRLQKICPDVCEKITSR